MITIQRVPDTTKPQSYRATDIHAAYWKAKDRGDEALAKAIKGHLNHPSSARVILLLTDDGATWWLLAQ